MKDIDEYKRYLYELIEKDKVGRMGKCFKTESKLYFYDTGTGKILECTEKEYKFLEQMLRNDSECLKEEDNKTILELMQNNLLQHSEIARLYTRDHMENLESNIHNNLYQINLEVTEKCNLRCNLKSV